MDDTTEIGLGGIDDNEDFDGDSKLLSPESGLQRPRQACGSVFEVGSARRRLDEDPLYPFYPCLRTSIVYSTGSLLFFLGQYSDVILNFSK